MGKRAVLSVGEKKVVCAYKEQYPGVQASDIMPTVSPTLTPILVVDEVWHSNRV
jgi:hypothetical protein